MGSPLAEDYGRRLRIIKLALLGALLACTAHAQLSPLFYSVSCPSLPAVVSSVVSQAVRKEARMGASLIRLFFHDCFVNGCDASVLLDDTATFVGEKSALPNKNSLRGFDVIDAIKTKVEAACPGVVSCADIVALAARFGVFSLGGPAYPIPLGRRDSTTASRSKANSELPSPLASLSTLISSFSNKGLDARDMTALSGGHTVGQAHCSTFRKRIYNDANIDPAFASTRKATCPASGGGSSLAPLDQRTPTLFDNAYYRDLVAGRGLLHSDQQLFNNGSQDALVGSYARNAALFFRDFSSAMVKMGSISPLTGNAGQIRKNCRKVN